ncbi:MAG: sulfatase-like hydrolase/transferase [Bryobacterales bacterium]|nr:sulfatase-like hydrolase/transferase [Bryobacterales bacterium]
MEFSRRTALSLVESALLGRSQDLPAAQNHPRSRPPNIVLLQADYMGYTDTQPYGASDILTPNLQRLTNEGVSFSDAYATASICAPSRAALLTGRYQARFGLERNPPPEPYGATRKAARKGRWKMS